MTYMSIFKKPESPMISIYTWIDFVKKIKRLSARGLPWRSPTQVLTSPYAA